MEKYTFVGLSVISLFSALMVIVSRKQIHSLLYLILCFFSLGGHYVLLNAQFLAVVHVIVYAGAIMVLFLFALMFINISEHHISRKSIISRIGAAVAGGVFLVALAGMLHGLSEENTSLNNVVQMGTTKEIGKILFNEYVIPFEVASILFLTAMVGAVSLGFSEKKNKC